MTPMKMWMRAATPEEQQMLAVRSGTTRAYLYHLSAGDEKPYHREPGADLAAAIERATIEMNATSEGRLPVIYRTDLVNACRNCEFARKCLGAIAERADFPIVAGDTEGGGHD